MTAQSRFVVVGGVSFATHDGSNSHIDPLCHYVVQSMRDNPTLYNGKPQNLTGNGCEGGASIDESRAASSSTCRC